MSTLNGFTLWDSLWPFVMPLFSLHGFWQQLRLPSSIPASLFSLVLESWTMDPDSSQCMGCLIHPDETACSRSHPRSSEVTQLHLRGEKHLLFHLSLAQDCYLRFHDSLTRCRWGRCYITKSIHWWGFMWNKLFSIRTYLSLFELDTKYYT